MEHVKFTSSKEITARCCLLPEKAESSLCTQLCTYCVKGIMDVHKANLNRSCQYTADNGHRQ